MNPLSGTKDFLSTGILEQSRKIQDLKAENEKLKYELDDYKNRIEPNYIKMVEYLEYLETQYNENIEDLEAQYNDRLAKYQNDAEEYYNNQCKDLEINLTRYKELIEPTYLGKIKELEEKLNQENEKPTCIKKIDELEPKYKEKIKSLEARYNNVIHNHQQAEEMYNKKLKELTAEIETYKETTKHLEEENSKLNQERLNDLNNYIKPKIEPVYEEKIRNLEAGYNDKLVKAQKESKEKTSVEDQNAASSSLSSSDKVITSPQDTALQIVFAYDNLQNADSDEDDKNFNEDMKEKDDKNLSGRVQTTMAV
ncbi:12053_t:CDS:2 [Entrophospora sp. SA101]|nr:12053_t:CDS:2 [Entrophospora sp. SA101]